MINDLLARLRMAEELRRVGNGEEPVTPTRGAVFIATSYGADLLRVMDAVAWYDGATPQDEHMVLDAGVNVWRGPEGEERRKFCLYLAESLKSLEGLCA